MVLSRELRITPDCAFDWLDLRWSEHRLGTGRSDYLYVGELNADPPAVAAWLRELAADAEAVSDLAEHCSIRDE